MKRLTAILLALITAFTLCACQPAAPEPEPTTAFEAVPTPTPTPTGIELWRVNAEKRFNMEYGDFAEYWLMLGDGFFGGSAEKILSVFPFEEKNGEIEAARQERNEKYGSDWHYKISKMAFEELGEKACTDFEKELVKLAERMDIFTAAAENWSDEQWQDFADGLGCTVGEARILAEAYGEMAETCREAKVTSAKNINMTLEFEGSKTDGVLTRSESDTVYEINGDFASVMLLDSTAMLINLIY